MTCPVWQGHGDQHWPTLRDSNYGCCLILTHWDQKHVVEQPRWRYWCMFSCTANSFNSVICLKCSIWASQLPLFYIQSASLWEPLLVILTCRWRFSVIQLMVNQSVSATSQQGQKPALPSSQVGMKLFVREVKRTIPVGCSALWFTLIPTNQEGHSSVMRLTEDLYSGVLSPMRFIVHMKLFIWKFIWKYARKYLHAVTYIF